MYLLFSDSLLKIRQQSHTISKSYLNKNLFISFLCRFNSFYDTQYAQYHIPLLTLIWSQAWKHHEFIYILDSILYSPFPCPATVNVMPTDWKARQLLLGYRWHAHKYVVEETAVEIYPTSLANRLVSASYLT